MATPPAREFGKINLSTIIFQAAISLFLIILLFLAIDTKKVIEILSQSKPEFFAAAFFAYLLINLLMSFRIRRLLLAMGKDIPFLQAARSHYLGMLASDFTPARSGYFLTAFSLNSHKVPLSSAIASILGPQMFDFAVKVIGTVAVFSILIMSMDISGGAVLAVVVSALTVIVFVAIIGGVLFYPKISIPALPFILKIPFVGKQLHFLITKLSESSPALKKELPLILLVLAFTWALKGIEWFLLAQMLGIEVNTFLPQIVFFMMLQPFVTLLQFLPSPTLAGFGISEAGAVAILGLFGISAAPAAAFALMTRFLMLSQNLIGLVEWPSLSISSFDRKNW